MISYLEENEVDEMDLKDKDLEGNNALHIAIFLGKKNVLFQNFG